LARTCAATINACIGLELHVVTIFALCAVRLTLARYAIFNVAKVALADWEVIDCQKIQEKVCFAFNTNAVVGALNAGVLAWHACKWLGVVVPHLSVSIWAICAIVKWRVDKITEITSSATGYASVSDVVVSVTFTAVGAVENIFGKKLAVVAIGWTMRTSVGWIEEKASGTNGAFEGRVCNWASCAIVNCIWTEIALGVCGVKKSSWDAGLTSLSVICAGGAMGCLTGFTWESCCKIARNASGAGCDTGACDAVGDAWLADDSQDSLVDGVGRGGIERKELGFTLAASLVCVASLAV
jgi:hypothetical protein